MKQLAAALDEAGELRARGEQLRARIDAHCGWWAAIDGLDDTTARELLDFALAVVGRRPAARRNRAPPRRTVAGSGRRALLVVRCTSVVELMSGARGIVGFDTACLRQRGR
ncbi:MAG: hypothetical protein KatS3mg010_1530 [Acidimicrobiia bacterium]|nr:MAG: hypothetical protein KatS3mg010_1530 [Acidimicrobiia bacterium]